MNTIVIAGAGIGGALAGWYSSGSRSLRLTLGPKQMLIARAIASSMSAGLCVAVAWHFRANWGVPPYCLFVVTLVLASLVDVLDFRIPRVLMDRASIAGGALLVVASGATHRWSSLVVASLCTVVAFSIFLMLHLVSRRGLGFGDVRMAALCGEFLGWQSASQAVAGLTAGVALAGVGAVVLMCLGIVSRKSRIPFGPFLAGGAIIALLAL